MPIDRPERKFDAKEIMKNSRPDWYDDDEQTDFWWMGDYSPIEVAFGNIVVQEVAGSYQGDNFNFYDAGDGKFFYLTFGWGSCSGCDWLQACNSWEEVQELVDSLWESTVWFADAQDALDWFEKHDWEGDWSWHTEEVHNFVKSVKEHLAQVLDS